MAFMKNNSDNNGNHEKKSEDVSKLREETLKYILYRVIQTT